MRAGTLATIVLLALATAGCAGDAPPLLHAVNATDQPIDLHVVIRKVVDGAPGAIARQIDLNVPALASLDRAVKLDGIHNVTASTPDGLQASADVEFWSGSYLGGQMYLGITIEADGIGIEEYHAD